ncbi:MAG: hypothetical protein WBE89_01125 [Methyloceanibacter sp.]|jgi:hypothetical protein
MTVYIRPHGDDKNDGSSAQKAVRSPQQAAKIALRNQDWEINIDVHDFDRINRELVAMQGRSDSRLGQVTPTASQAGEARGSACQRP